MIPTIILHQLARLRRRERLLAFAWGLAQWLTLIVLVLLLACSIDWLVDRRQETPWLLRGALLVGQAMLWGAAAAFFIVAPQLRNLSNNRLALWVESRLPDFDHRLISAVQLNRQGADVAGMSPQLIATTTKEAEQRTNALDFVKLLNHRRLRWSGMLLLATGLVLFFAMLWVGPGTLRVLFARQLLADEAIPRNIQLESVTPVVWPSGEAVVLRFHVTRKPMLWGWPELGTVRIYPVGRGSEDYALSPGALSDSLEATFLATIPASSIDFTYRAWLGDGRTRDAGRVRFEPRPAVKKQDAWVLLPEYVGRRPDGKAYEQYQPRGEIVALFGSSARVSIETQKPITDATLELLGQPAPEVLARLPVNALVLPATPQAALVDLVPQLLALHNAEQISTAGSAAQNELGPELVRRRLPMKLTDDQHAEASFELRPTETAYRIVVHDHYQFANADPPRRGLALVHDEPPHVELLPEHFTSAVGQPLTAETEVEGKPIPMAAGGGKIRIAYRAQDPYGLARAQLRYRILRKEDPDNPGPWSRLPLDEIKIEGDPANLGPFDPLQGVFRTSGLDDQIEFFAEPSRDPLQSPGRLEGGGRFDFQTGALGLRIGDQIEFFVEVADKNPDPERNLGRTDARRKIVVTAEELTQWLLHKAEHENRIRDLEKRQREVPLRPGER
jgi:hypothetical protein